MLGDIGLLKRYQRQRKADNLAMMAAVEGLKRLFQPLPLPFRWARNMGMNIFHDQSQLKNKVIKHAMGIDR
jgi:2-octaprenylphenol hydroxylase